jgi:hypothetical protein
MTLVGKIFTMLIFVLSIVFMAFAMMVFATHKNWKTTATTLQTTLTATQTAVNDAKQQLQNLQTEYAREQAARRAALAALQVRAIGAEERLAAKERELGALIAAHSEATQVAREAQSRLAMLETETKGLRDNLRGEQQQRDRLLITAIDLTEKLNQAESLRQSLEEVNAQATRQMTQMKQVLDAHGLRPDTLVTHIPPKVEGIVTDVSDRDLLEISIGADDGLKVGHALDVYRGNQYLGRIVIKRTSPDRAVGQVMRELQRGQIKRGDRVTTRFS